MLCASDEEPGAQRGRDFPRIAQQTSVELGPEFGAHRALGRAPFGAIGLCRPISGIRCISPCVTISPQVVS